MESKKAHYGFSPTLLQQQKKNIKYRLERVTSVWSDELDLNVMSYYRVLIGLLWPNWGIHVGIVREQKEILIKDSDCKLDGKIKGFVLLS